MEINIKFRPNPDYRLMDQVREVLRYYHYAYKTEQSYCSWILQYIRFYGNDKHPKDMGKNEVERFLSFLTEKRNVSAATQNQALNALIFLYKKLWGQCFHEQNHLLLELEQDGILIHVPQDEKKLVI